MNNLVILNKDNFDIKYDKNFKKGSINKDINQIFYTNIFDLIKDLEHISNSDYYILKFEDKSIIYRKTKETKLAIVIICEKNSIKKNTLIELSKIYTLYIDKNNDIEGVNFIKNFKDITLQGIEQLNIMFIEQLRKNKLYAKFIYYNYNPNVSNSISYKKTKLESTSVILYNSNKDQDKIIEPKDTILQKSTIKEKDLNLEIEKKSLPPTDKKIFVKKFNNVITKDSLKKKNLSKNFTQNFFIEKYFLTKNTMIHYLFNNIFIEGQAKDQIDPNNFTYPINGDNEHILLFLLDIYDKAQQLFSVPKTNSQEYLDIVNYIELNLTKPDTMCII